MSVTSTQDVARIMTFPDVTDLTMTPDSVSKLRARNFKVGLLNPEPYIGDVPVAGTWMSGTVIVPTPLDLSSKLQVDLMHNLQFRCTDWALLEVGTVPAGMLPGGCFTTEVYEDAKTSGTAQTNEWMAVKTRQYWTMCSGNQQPWVLHRRLHAYNNQTLVVGVDPSARLAKPQALLSCVL